MSSGSSWFPTRRWFRAAGWAFCLLPSLMIGIAMNWKVGVAWMVMGLAAFAVIERRWYSKS